MALRLVAAMSLAAAVVVIVVTPMILEWPNPLSTPAALVVAIGCGGALVGGRGDRVALAISALGLVLSALWLWLASDGFGKGTPWWDDIVEAAVLAAVFLVAVVVLLLAGRRRSPS